MSGLNDEQCAMGRAAQQFAVGVQKLVGLPLQRNAEVGAAIKVNVETVVASHNNKRLAGLRETARQTFGHTAASTQCSHRV